MRKVRYLFLVLGLFFFSVYSQQKEITDNGINIGPAIDSPAVLDKGLFSITVPDIHATFEEVGGIVSQVAPMMGGPVLKTLVGQNLGDPALAGIAQGDGLTIVMLSPQNFFVVIEVQPDYQDLYAQALQSNGFFVEKEDGLLIASPVETFAQKAKSMAKDIQSKLLDKKRDTTLFVSASPARLVAENEGVLRAKLDDMIAEMQASEEAGPDVSRFMGAYVTELISLASQVDGFEFDVALDSGKIRFSETVKPVVGSRLDAYCNAPSINDYNPKINLGLLGEGAIKFEGCLRNKEALVQFMRGELENLSYELGYGFDFTENMVVLCERSLKAIGSTFCETINFIEEEPYMEISELIDVQNKDELLDVYRTMEESMYPVYSFYESLGIKMSCKFKENVDSYNGLDLHKVRMDMEFDEDFGDSEELSDIIGDFDITLAMNDDIYALSNSEDQLKSIFDRAQNGSEVSGALYAREALPAGGCFYADIDVAKYMIFFTTLMENVSDGAEEEIPEDVNETMKQLSMFLQDMKPIVYGGYCNSGMLEVYAEIPADLISRIAQFVFMQAMSAE